MVTRNKALLHNKPLALFSHTNLPDDLTNADTAQDMAIVLDADTTTDVLTVDVSSESDVPPIFTPLSTEPARHWTDEEYRQATIRLYFGSGERAEEVDREKYAQERVRRGLMAERNDQIFFVVHDFSIGREDSFAPMVYSRYDNDIFFKMAATLSDQRNDIIYQRENYSQYISAEDADNRMSRLSEQFDAAFSKLAKLIQSYIVEAK